MYAPEDGTNSIRVLVVDDYERGRRFVSATIQKELELQLIGQASDGQEAVHQAQELQPELILLDVGIPGLNGIEAARQIRKVFPASRILFLSENRSVDIAEGALSAGAGGYVLKSHAHELLSAIKAILEGKRFVNVSVAGHDSSRVNDRAAVINHCHEVAFYPDDTSLVDGYARFTELALKSGHAVIALVTEPHRSSLLPRLEADCVDMDAVIAQGRYIPLDAAYTLSR